MTARRRQVQLALMARPIFRQGELVRFIGWEGTPVVSPLVEGQEYVIGGTSGAGRWVSIIDPGSLRVLHQGIGPSYFRIVGPCGGHRATWRPREEQMHDHLERARELGFSLLLGWHCARCDAPCPEALSTYHLYHQ